VEFAELLQALNRRLANASARGRGRGRRLLLALERVDALILAGLHPLILGVAFAHGVGTTAYRRCTK
jgi:hypothetical protein